jgi:hypothetical protein
MIKDLHRGPATRLERVSDSMDNFFQEIFTEGLFVQRRVADILLFAICYLPSGRASGESGKAT